MNIDNFTLGELKQIAAIVNNQVAQPTASTAPHQQQPRLTDEEIEDFADASTGYSRMVDIKYFARAIEKKVRGEA